MKLGPIFLPLGRPAIMGIVNVTPDSFSDGGEAFDPSAAVERAQKLVAQGADLLDIGGESSRPGAEPISADEELRRVIPVIRGIRLTSSVPISIDTTKAMVAERALEAGATMVNDISAGRFDAAMLPLVAQRKCALCLMHMQGDPRTMQEAPHYEDAVSDIKFFLMQAIECAVSQGIDRSCLCVDPGIGFGKRLEDNLAILRRLRGFSDLGLPILIGTSRKAFIGQVLKTQVSDRLEGTLATLAAAVNGGAAILRVHDVLAARRFVDMYEACAPESFSVASMSGKMALKIPSPSRLMS